MYISIQTYHTIHKVPPRRHKRTIFHPARCKLLRFHARSRYEPP